MILLGPPCVGKTHIAIGLGLEAIQNGHKVSFLHNGRTNKYTQDPGLSP